MTGKRLSAFVIVGLVGISAIALFVLVRPRSDKPGVANSIQGGPVSASSPTGASVSDDRRSEETRLADGIRGGDNLALAGLCAKLKQDAESGSRKPITDVEAQELNGVLGGLREGFLKFKGAVGRASVLSASTMILEKFTVSPAPSNWVDSLQPTRDILAAGLSDDDANVRASALLEIAKLWNFAPGRSMMPVEENTLAEWKDSFHRPVVQRLGDKEAGCRAAAIVCLGQNPIDSMASPAVVYIDDMRSGDVRRAVLSAFARRTSILTEDAILKRLHDPELGIPQLAEMVLKGRGLSRDHIFLGRLITDPSPDKRGSVIPLLKEKDDIDPSVWLLQLSRDADETVRSLSAKALAGVKLDEAKRRLREMASGDQSKTVREVAEKIVQQFSEGETTAALPPLPGSPRLNPRAN